jgi:hypothetical protein
VVTKKGKLVLTPLTSDDLVFKEEDIHKVSDILARMLRYLFVKLEITNEQLQDRFSAHAARLGLRSTEANYWKNNTLKAILNDSITMKSFMNVLVNILELNPSNLSLTVTLPNSKEEIVISMDT